MRNRRELGRNKKAGKYETKTRKYRKEGCQQKMERGRNLKVSGRRKRRDAEMIQMLHRSNV